MRRVLTALVLAIVSSVLLAGLSAAAAQKIITPPGPDQPTSPQEPTSAPRAFEDIRTYEELRATGRPLALVAGLGTLVHLSTNASTVFVADPEVADVQVKAPSDLVYLFGKKAGSTVLYAVGSQGEILLNSVVQVKANSAEPVYALSRHKRHV